MRPARPTFLYDADCGACTRFSRLVSFFDPSHSVAFVPIAEAGAEGLLDSVPRSQWFSCSRMVGPDGSIDSGGDSLVALLKFLPWGRIPASLISILPFGLPSTRWFYSVVSRLHGSSCAAPSITPRISVPSVAWSSP